MFIPQEIPEATRVAAPLRTSDAPVPTVIPDLPRVYLQISSEVGYRTLWVVFVLMVLSSVTFYVMAMRVPVQKRLFHIIAALITTISVLSYYAMATGDGITMHPYVTKISKHGEIIEIVNRQVYWVRYVDWALTTPLLLLDLCLIAGINGASILIAVVSALIMILSGLFAALARYEAQGWGWYVIACIAYLNVVYQVGYKGRHAITTRDNKTRAFWGAISLYTLLLWTVYPIVWAIADGARRVNVDGEIIAYAVLDVLTKGVIGFWLLLTYNNMPRMFPAIDGFWSQGVPHDGSIRVGEGRTLDD
ncbi:opsin-1 [Daldinia vernicosa]|uniref:opsin-1 n=1 Tax=Daldinia vernicosa TaxID=114800 RepID=UPI0020077433|nr:opsin-1 [Daldinia vernicosa]KAI0851244.1 opsin-1 [Daldinia vernicosa]